MGGIEEGSFYYSLCFIEEQPMSKTKYYEDGLYTHTHPYTCTHAHETYLSRGGFHASISYLKKLLQINTLDGREIFL